MRFIAILSVLVLSGSSLLAAQPQARAMPDDQPLASSASGSYGAALGGAIIYSVTVCTILGGTIGGIIGYSIGKNFGSTMAGMGIGILAGGLGALAFWLVMVGHDRGISGPTMFVTATGDRNSLPAQALVMNQVTRPNPLHPEHTYTIFSQTRHF